MGSLQKLLQHRSKAIFSPLSINLFDLQKNPKTPKPQNPIVTI